MADKNGASLGFGDEEGTFGGSDPNFSKDTRFLGIDREGKSKRHLHPEDNKVAILPPFANYFDRFIEMRKKARESGIRPVYPIGNRYLRLKIKTFKDKYTWNYRVDMDNPVIQAFGKVYGHLKGSDGKFTDKLKAITKDFTGFPDHRSVLNVYDPKNPSEIRLLDLPTDRKKVPDKSKGKIMSKIEAVYDECVPETPRRLPLFDLDENVPLSIYVVIPGDGVPNWGGVKAIRDDSGSLKCVDMKGILDKCLEGGFDEEILNAAEEFATTLDEVPDLEDIPSLVSDPDACDILGISTRNVDTSDNKVAVNSDVQSKLPSGPPPGSVSEGNEKGTETDNEGDNGSSPSSSEDVSAAFDSFGSSGEDAAAQFMQQLKSDEDDGGSADDGQSSLDRAVSGGVDPNEPPF